MVRAPSLYVRRASQPTDVELRDADPLRDAGACAAIYEPYVTGSPASFEYDAPSPEEISRRIASAHVWLVADAGEGPVGFAYGSRHRDRSAYAWAADVSVYIHRDHHRRGLGRLLYARLFERLRTIGLWTLCAGITEPNAASTGLHGSMGFELVGVYRRIGWKDGSWHDVSWWQLDLRPGEPGPPPPLAREPTSG